MSDDNKNDDLSLFGWGVISPEAQEEICVKLKKMIREDHIRVFGGWTAEIYTDENGVRHLLN